MCQQKNGCPKALWCKGWCLLDTEGEIHRNCEAEELMWRKSGWYLSRNPPCLLLWVCRCGGFNRLPMLTSECIWKWYFHVQWYESQRTGIPSGLDPKTCQLFFYYLNGIQISPQDLISHKGAAVLLPITGSHFQSNYKLTLGNSN